MPSMTSRLPAVESWVTTGATATTWSSLRRRSATLMDTGAPLTPISSDEPGGCTMMSAPMPTCRFLVSVSMPTERPTIRRIRVTSTATATMLMMVRKGRCTRLAKIILFMVHFDCNGCKLRHSTASPVPELAYRPERYSQPRDSLRDFFNRDRDNRSARTPRQAADASRRQQSCSPDASSRTRPTSARPIPRRMPTTDARRVTPCCSVRPDTPTSTSSTAIYYCTNVSCMPEGDWQEACCCGHLSLCWDWKRWPMRVASNFRREPRMAQLRMISSGPGRMSEALGITRPRDNGKDFTSARSDLWIADDGYRPARNRRHASHRHQEGQSTSRCGS